MFAGKVYSPVMPVPIPVYMTIELAIAVGLVDGTDDDYYKVLADIEAQMRGGKTEIDDTDGRCRDDVSPQRTIRVGKKIMIFWLE